MVLKVDKITVNEPIPDGSFSFEYPRAQL